jgi:ferrous-iron efflux pump FieF
MAINMEDNQYARMVKWASALATATAFILLVIKSAAFMMTGAVSILASLVDSLMDIGISLVNLMAVHYALQPPDKQHKFGHGKAEHVAGLAQSAFICGTSVMLLYNGVLSAWYQDPLEATGAGIWVMIVSSALTFVLVMYQRYVVSKTNNAVIKADSIHYATDVYMNLAVLLALVLSTHGWLWADGVLTIAIAFYIFWGAWQIGHESFQALLDRELPENFQAEVMDLVCSVDGVLGAHDLRTRQSGQTKFVQVHIELDDKLNILVAHQISDDVVEKLLARWPELDVLIHQDPLSMVGSEVSLGLAE